MQIIVVYDGETYHSRRDDTVTVKAAADALYEKLHELNKLRLETENGGVILFPLEAISRAVIKIIP